MFGRRKILAVVISIFAAIALAVSVYLTWVLWQSGSVAGCTAETLLDCDSVLSSRWSKWLGLPVSLLGVLTYLVILCVVWPAAWRPRGLAATALLALGTLAAGAGLWFVGLQAIQLQSFCFYCLTVHVCGLVVAVSSLLLFLDASGGEQYQPMQAMFAAPDAQPLPDESVSAGPVEVSHLLGALAVAAVGLAALMGGQLLSDATESMDMEEFALPAPTAETKLNSDEPDETMAVAIDQDTDEVEEDSESESEALEEVNTTNLAEGVAESPGADVSSTTDDSLFSNTRRRLSFEALPKSVEVTAMPVLGDPQAEFVVVEMMDYTCTHCRHLHPHMRAALDHYGGQLAVVIEHVPLSKKCNPNVQQDFPGKKYACDYAQLAIGVWNLAPEKFPEFHDWLLESENPPNIGLAKQRAMKLVGSEVLTDKKLKAEVTRRLSQQTADLARLKVGLPVLLYSNGAIRGVPQQSEKLFELLESKMPGLKPAVSASP